MDTNTKGEPRPIFNPGKLFISRGVKALLDQGEITRTEVSVCLLSHLEGFWGESDRSWKRANEQSLLDGGSLCSHHRSTSGNWLVVFTTAADQKGRRERTTVFLDGER